MADSRVTQTHWLIAFNPTCSIAVLRLMPVTKASNRVAKIDTTRCRLLMLTGEYHYSCRTEMSAATAAKILGAYFQSMPGIGQFLLAENPGRS